MTTEAGRPDVQDYAETLTECSPFKVKWVASIERCTACYALVVGLWRVLLRTVLHVCSRDTPPWDALQRSVTGPLLGGGGL